MQLDRTTRLVKRLKSYCEENKILQKTLALQLGLSPQGVFEIFKGNNSPSAETALHIIELIEPQFMRTIVDPAAAPQASTRDPNEPKTLHEAKGMIEALRAQLKGGAVSLPAKFASAPATLKPAAATTAMEREIARASAARMKGLSSKPLAEQSVAELQVALSNAKPEDRDEIYRALKSREGDTALRAFTASRR